MIAGDAGWHRRIGRAGHVPPRFTQAMQMQMKWKGGIIVG